MNLSSIPSKCGIYRRVAVSLQWNYPCILHFFLFVGYLLVHTLQEHSNYNKQVEYEFKK